MKKITAILFLLIASANMYSQSGASEQAPMIGAPQPPYSGSSDRALWDIQLDVSAPGIARGLAACYWTGTEFWVAKWASDTMYTLNAAGIITSGPFSVAGVTGARSITSDGISLYMGCNATDIKKVDPVTKTLISTITTSVPNCRYLAYDPTLNGGAGGMWTGTFASDFTAVDMSGATLTTIMASVHTLTGVYGLAYDGYSSGGPYLWANDQGNGTTGTAILRQINIATGAPTGLMHNTETDLQGGNTGIGGGVFVGNNFSVGTITIGGIDQGASLFAYNITALMSVESPTTKEFEMDVFPNPTSDVSTISFNLKKENSVKMEVYTTIGSLVYAKNEEAMNAGKHTLTFNTANLDNGFYFVKLTIGNQTAVQKVSVNK